VSNNALVLENVYHQILLRGCKGEEEQQFENMRHEIMAESIVESCNYYGLRRCTHENENERERE